MKDIIRAMFIIGGCLFSIPLIVVYASGYKEGQMLAMINESTPDEEKDIVTKEALISVLAKEIPYTYEDEAIKAQAVITRTYMARRILGYQNKGQLIGYTKEEMKVLWGEHYETIYAAYEAAVEETENEMLFYKDNLIEPLYHRASAGHTRDASEIYNMEVSYLKGVESKQDTITKQVKLSKENIVEKLRNQYSNLEVETDLLENQIQIIERDAAEYVKSIQVGNIILQGEEFRNLLGLPSSNFKIFKMDEDLIFDVKGIGNGIGLSQNGANELAKEGMDYKNILHFYYTDIEIKQYEN